jgi:hypothetical protein
MRHDLIVARVRGLVVMALAGASFALGGGAPPPSSAQPGAPPKQPAPTVVTPMPVPETAQRAEEVTTLLRQSADAVATDPEVQDIDNRLPAARGWILGRLAATTQTLASSPSSTALANLTDSCEDSS